MHEQTAFTAVSAPGNLDGILSTEQAPLCVTPRRNISKTTAVTR